VESEVGQLVPEGLPGIALVRPDHDRPGPGHGESRTPGRTSAAEQRVGPAGSPHHDEPDAPGHQVAQPVPGPGQVGFLGEGNGQGEIGRTGDREDIADPDPVEPRRGRGDRELQGQDQEEPERGTSSPLAVRSRSSWQRWAQGAKRLAATPSVQVARAASRSPAYHWARPRS
jgi:hypothetical protein